MKTVYKAKDGTIFDSSVECERYEMQLDGNDFEEDLNRILYVRSKQIIPIQNVDMVYLYDVCYIPDEAALRAIKTLRNYKYSDIRIGYNYFIYDGDDEQWEQNTIENLIEERDDINKTIEILEDIIVYMQPLVNMLPVKAEEKKKKKVQQEFEFTFNPEEAEEIHNKLDVDYKVNREQGFI